MRPRDIVALIAGAGYCVGLVALPVAGLLLLAAARYDPNVVRCGQQTMQPRDTCVEMELGGYDDDVYEHDYEQVQAQQAHQFKRRWGRRGLIAIVLLPLSYAVLAVYNRLEARTQATSAQASDASGP